MSDNLTPWAICQKIRRQAVDYAVLNAAAEQMEQALIRLAREFGEHRCENMDCWLDVTKPECFAELLGVPAGLNEQA